MSSSNARVECTSCAETRREARPKQGSMIQSHLINKTHINTPRLGKNKKQKNRSKRHGDTPPTRRPATLYVVRAPRARARPTQKKSGGTAVYAALFGALNLDAPAPSPQPPPLRRPPPPGSRKMPTNLALSKKLVQRSDRVKSVDMVRALAARRAPPRARPRAAARRPALIVAAQPLSSPPSPDSTRRSRG